MERAISMLPKLSPPGPPLKPFSSSSIWNWKGVTKCRGTVLDGLEVNRKPLATSEDDGEGDEDGIEEAAAAEALAALE